MSHASQYLEEAIETARRIPAGEIEALADELASLRESIQAHSALDILIVAFGKARWPLSSSRPPM